jgi:hypothetical protein
MQQQLLLLKAPKQVCTLCKRYILYLVHKKHYYVSSRPKQGVQHLVGYEWLGQQLPRLAASMAQQQQQQH